MSFQRTYDVSCVMDDLSRTALQNAIEAVNMACTPTVNAWLYVESKEIAQDYNKLIDPTDTMRSTIFNHMKLEGHSGCSITYTINALVYLSTNYASWKKDHEEKNSLIEGEIQMIQQFRQNTLVPYYRSMSGGGCIRTGTGPVVDEFMAIYDTLAYNWIPEISRAYHEVTNLLGITIDEKLQSLNDILDSVFYSLRLSNYRDSLKMRLEQEKRMDDSHGEWINQHIPILNDAIQSRNPVALEAALNPGWGSMRLFQLKEYQDAQELLDKLSSSGVHVAENRS
jgi:hypothetical protein